jgi:hypothetical protein
MSQYPTRPDIPCARRTPSAAPRLTSREAVRVLLILGFRVVGANPLQVTLDRGGRLAFVPRRDELSDTALDALMRNVGVGPPELTALIARVRDRDTLPDSHERLESQPPGGS